MTFRKGDPNINRNGRPKSPEIEELRNAIKEATKTHEGRSLLQHFVEKAYDDNSVLVACIKKLIPDKHQMEAEVIADVHIMPTIEKDDKPMEHNVGS